MKVLVAPNPLKGSLSAAETAAAIEEGIKRAAACEVRVLNIADGGDDTLDALACKTHSCEVKNAFGAPVISKWGELKDVAVIELAKASGIAMVEEDALDPFSASTYGTGELIMDAYRNGFRKFLLCIGGSATMDGGMGALVALGAQFFDAEGTELQFGSNEEVGRVARYNMDRMPRDLSFTIACDVNNPLLGPNGAVYVFGPQKFAPRNRKNAELLAKAESNLAHYNSVLPGHHEEEPGTGAAGGFPISIMSFFECKLQKGAELILDTVGIDSCKDFDVAFTSEGRCDTQTLNGKAPHALCNRMRQSYTVVLCGSIESDSVVEKMKEAGAKRVVTINPDGFDLPYCMSHAHELVAAAAEKEMLRFIDPLK